MADKLALLLLGGILVTATGAGAAIGIYIGGDGPLLDSVGGVGAADATATASAADASGGPGEGGTDGGGTERQSATPAPTATPNGATDDGPPPSTATPTETRTPTPGPLGPDSLNETRIELLVVAEINDRRVERGLQKLRRDEVLFRMAGNHSRRMSRQGYVSHAAGGYSTEERYRRNDRYDACKIPDDSDTSIRTGEAIETVDKVSAGWEFDNRTNRNESQVARDAVGNWFAQDSEREKLTYEAAEYLGVGVHVSGSNRAYVTVDLC